MKKRWIFIVCLLVTLSTLASITFIKSSAAVKTCKEVIEQLDSDNIMAQKVNQLLNHMDKNELKEDKIEIEQCNAEDNNEVINEDNNSNIAIDYINNDAFIDVNEPSTNEVTEGESVTDMEDTSNAENSENATTVNATPNEDNSSNNTSVNSTNNQSSQITPSNIQSSDDIMPELGCTRIEYEVFELINQYRASVGLGTVTWSSRLYEGAKVRSKEITTCFSHTRPNGESYRQLVGNNTSENIASGSSTAVEVFNRWMNSQAHRDNILRPDAVSCAVALYKTNSGYKYYWVNVIELNF